MFEEVFCTVTPTFWTSSGSSGSAWFARLSSSICAMFWSKSGSKVTVMIESPLLVLFEDM